MENASKQEQQTRKTGMIRLLEITGIKKGLVLLSIMFAALAAICSFIPYLAIYFVIDELISIYPNFGLIDPATMIRYSKLAIGGTALNVILYFFALCFSHFAAFGTLRQLKLDFASHLARVPLGLHVITGSGKLRKIMDENVEKIEGFIAHDLPDIVAAIVAAIAMMVIVFVINWIFGVAVFVGVLVALLIQVSMYGNDFTKTKAAEMQKRLEEMNNASVEYIRGISVVKAFKQTVYSFRRLKESIRSYTELVIAFSLGWENQMSAFTTVINNLYLFVVPVGVIGLAMGGSVSFLSQFVFYLIFVPSIATILMKLMYISANSARVTSGITAMDEILDSPELPRSRNPQKICEYSVSFNDVYFAYEGRNEFALRGVNFVAPQGKTTAIVGPSGGGKSTIAHLLPRFFDVSEGAITLGGIDIRQIAPEELMKQVSFVFQDVFLFKQSVRDNIAIGCANATAVQVEAAAKAAQCHDFIMKLPNGYETVIGTNDVHLSGGERQRLAIARAIVKNAPVVVLDEATAFSDPENEYLIQKAFEQLLSGKTVIMIAHRLSTIRSADNIIVIDGGKVVEQGAHEALLEKGGKYHAMWRVYQSTISWKMRKGATTNV
jgi:ATP-binding cassette subfamily B protein